MNSSVITLILRFRDLAVSDTINEHTNIIATSKEKYCWWGWWNKPQEQLPCDIFASLNNVAKNKTISIFLFDSGNKKMYIAKCREIKFSTDLSPFSLNEEEKNKVPSYYRTQEYLAWFKFEDIQEKEFNFEEFSYVNVDSFFREHKNSFQMFNNKKVCSIEELYYQQRTIWFIRNFKDGDYLQEINLMSDRKAIPQNYDDLFTQLSTNTLLWLSDLHFSKDYDDGKGGTINYHAFGNSTTDPNSDKLINKIQSKLDSQKLSPSAVIISGDITYKAQKEEFDLAEQFIRDIGSVYSIDPYNLAICPGNHDFSFRDQENITKTSEEASKNYKGFYKNIFNCEPSPTFSSVRRFITKNLTPVELIVLNSVSLQQVKTLGVKSELDNNFVGLGYVGNDQIEEVKKHMQSTNDSKAIRIVVIHHHIVPVLYSETPEFNKSYSLILDAGRVNKFIFENNISIVLHGHAHKQFYRRISAETVYTNYSDCNIIGIGSAGVCEVNLSEKEPHMIAALTFENDKLCIKKMNIDENEGSDIICEHVIEVRG